MRLALTMLMLLCIAALAPGCGCQRDKSGDETRETTGASRTAAIIDRVAAGQALSDWSLVEPAKAYAGEELYDPIDGAADKYFPFGFKEASFAFFKKGDALLEVQIYLMGSPDDASGVFSAYDDVNARERPLTKTRHTVAREGTMELSKGPYYVRVLLQQGELPPVDEGALERFARELTQQIPEDWHTPEILGFLPEGYVPGSVRYFRLASTQADVFYIADENVFGLSKETFGVSACYDTKTTEAGTQIGTNALFVIEYPSPDAAQAAFDAAREFFSREPYRTFGVTEGPEPQLLVQKGDADFVKLARCRRVLYGAWMIEDVAHINDLTAQLAARVRQRTQTGKAP